VAEELDTSRFSLKNYVSIDVFGIREWERQLTVRSYMWWCSNTDSDAFQEICDI
jgi:hypothetical protein